MKRTSSKNVGFVKPLLAAAGTVCAVTLAFQGLTQAALAAELGKAEAVPTSYAAAISPASEQGKPGLPDGYTKPSYTLAGSNRDKQGSERKREHRL